MRTRSAEAWVSVRAARDVTVREFSSASPQIKFVAGIGPTNLPINDRGFQRPIRANLLNIGTQIRQNLQRQIAQRLRSALDRLPGIAFREAQPEIFSHGLPGRLLLLQFELRGISGFRKCI